MQAAATIHDAARRLEEAATVFRFKSRTTLEELGELGGSWTDSRGQQFTVQHLQPQRDSIDQGARLCRILAEWIATALASAGEAERELLAFFSAQDEFESSAGSAHQAAQAADNLAARSVTVSSHVTGELQALNNAIASVAQDPGW
jgi:hypothetical protein